jgi:hypothetical protein
MQLLTGGEFFRHLVIYNLQPWEPGLWQAGIGRAWAMYPLAILAGLVTLVLALMQRWPALPALYLVFAWLSSATIGKHGAYINHLLEASVATWMACGLLLGWASKNRRVLWPLAASVALLIQVAMLIHLPYSLQSGTLPLWTTIKPAVKPWPWYKHNRAVYLWTPAEADVQAANVLDQRVRDAPGLILSEDGSFTATHGRPMWIQFQHFTELVRAGRWDQTPFLDQIRHQQFALVLLKSDLETDVFTDRLSLMTSEMQEAIRKYYILEKQSWLYYVYVPRPR